MSGTINIDWEMLAKANMHPVQVQILTVMTTQATPINEGQSKSKQSTKKIAGWSPAQMAAKFDKPVNAVSYHMRKMAKQKLIKFNGTLPRRGALEHFYLLNGQVTRDGN